MFEMWTAAGRDIRLSPRFFLLFIPLTSNKYIPKHTLTHNCNAIKLNGCNKFINQEAKEEKRTKMMTLNGRNWEEFFLILILFAFRLNVAYDLHKEWEWRERATGWHNKIIHYCILSRVGAYFVYTYRMGSDKSQNIDIY